MERYKLTEIQLKRSVLKNIEKSENANVEKAGVGTDSVRLFLRDKESGICSEELSESNSVAFDYCTAETLGIKNSLGYVTVDFIKACNNIRAVGGIPISMSNLLMLPSEHVDIEKHASEQLARMIIKELSQICKKENVIFGSGHTQVVPSLADAMVSMTVIGKADDYFLDNSKDWKKVLNVKNVKAGMDIVMCGQTGITGTVLLVNEYHEKLLERYSSDYLRTALRMDKLMALDNQVIEAVKSGACYAHDISTGGVYSALWEMASGAKCGLDIYHGAIPIMQETIEICEYFGLNPYMIDGSGAVLFAVEDGVELCNSLYAAGYEASLIGRFTDNNDRVIVHDDERRFLTPPDGKDAVC